jgi:hypothetical protein
MSITADNAPVSAGVRWARRLLGGLAIIYPSLASVLLWSELYLQGGVGRELISPRRWLGLIS